MSGIGDTLEKERSPGDALGGAEFDETVGGENGETVRAQVIETQDEGIEGCRIVEVTPVDEFEQIPFLRRGGPV